MTPFDDLDAYVALPRLAGLVLSPDGSRLVTAVTTLNPEKNGYRTALWAIDPAGRREAHRLTRSAKSEGQAAFLPDGSLLFVSARPDPELKDDDETAALWHLPAAGGEARVVARRPGGIAGLRVATAAGLVVVGSDTFPSAVTAEDDEKIRKQRKDGKVDAILHESYPIRYWDHDLGPDAPRLLCGTVPAAGAPGAATDEGRVELRDLTPNPGRSLFNAGCAVTPDGATVVTSVKLVEQGGEREGLAAIDVATGEQRTLLDDPDREFTSPVIDPTGRRVALTIWRRSSPTTPPDVDLGLLDLATGALRIVAEGWDRWPGTPVWTPDGSALIVVADENGRAPLFRIDLAATDSGADRVTRLTGDHGCYADPQASPDGVHVYAVRSAMDAAPAPVRLSATGVDQEPVPLLAPAASAPLPGTAVEITTTADDGTPLHAWLCLPEGASAQQPAPLMVWIHGGPLGSANDWAWRWNPWLMVARGYAVVQPDFSLSTGYGLDFVRRGWGRWGAEPYTDLMALTEAAAAREDVDGARAAAMGGSFGGYLANWVAGHTDRFAGIVTHASLWALDQFGPTTDGYDYWRRELTAQMASENSPHGFVDAITTPMLVIHGDQDYRVPIGEGLRLWAELCERFQAPGVEMPHKFLYFPSENHWVLTPNHAKLWYSTVFAFLDATVHGRPWQVPELLR